MKRTLIIYGDLDRGPDLYVVNFTDPEFEKFSRIAGKFVGSGMTTEERLIAHELETARKAWRPIDYFSAITYRADAILITGAIS